MRILLIHNFYQYWGGEDTYVSSLKKLLEENGHKVYLYSKDSENIKTVWDKIKVAFGLFYNPWVKKELTKIIKEFKPDITHFHNVYPVIGATAYRVCKKNNLKIVQHVHNYRFMCPKGILFRQGKICELCLHKKLPFYSIIYSCYHQSRLASFFFTLAFFYHNLIGTFKLIDKFIFPSEFTRDYYIKHLKIDFKKTYLLPYFVDVPKKLPKIKIKEKNFFLYIGRLSEEKGIIELLHVFKDLPDKKLIVIGDGPLRDKVKQYEKFQNIKYLGFMERKKIFSYIAECKALIIPSLWYEVLPNVLLEALKKNKTVLVKRNKNFSKLIKDNSFLFFKNKEKLISILSEFTYKRNKLNNKLKKTLSSLWHLNNLLKIYNSHSNF